MGRYAWDTSGLDSQKKGLVNIVTKFGITFKMGVFD
jgi:hypothetical protein